MSAGLPLCGGSSPWLLKFGMAMRALAMMRGLLVGPSVRARLVAWQRFTAGRRDFLVGRRTHNAFYGDLHAGIGSMRRTAAFGKGIVIVVTRAARAPARPNLFTLHGIPSWSLTPAIVAEGVGLLRG